jgi:hypothetical protein
VSGRTVRWVWKNAFATNLGIQGGKVALCLHQNNMEQPCEAPNSKDMGLSGQNGEVVCLGMFAEFGKCREWEGVASCRSWE